MDDDIVPRGLSLLIYIRQKKYEKRKTRGGKTNKAISD